MAVRISSLWAEFALGRLVLVAGVLVGGWTARQPLWGAELDDPTSARRAATARLAPRDELPDDPGIVPYVTAADYEQPPAAVTPAPSTTSPPPLSSRPSYRSTYARLARAPNMFGDSLIPLGTVTVQGFDSQNPITADLPGFGGRLLKVGENNQPLPTDRIYFLYNGFQNALAAGQGFGPAVGGVRAFDDLHRYTLGFEKTFFDGQSSLELRLPLVNAFQFSADNSTIDRGSMGDIALVFKQLLSAGESHALAAGASISLPTGSDTRTNWQGSPIVFKNQTTYISPYVGLLLTPNDDWFVQFFGQLDFAAGDSAIVTPDSPQVGLDMSAPHLAQADMSLGRWLYQAGEGAYLRGVAGIVELHYLTSLQALQQIQFQTSGANVWLNQGADRFDILNLTAGLHFRLGDNSNLRVGTVVPLRTDPNRAFDGEMQVSYNRYF